MAARQTPGRGTIKGNFLAEWFGHRVWPTVDISAQAAANQSRGVCPFLSGTLGEERICVKTARGFDGPTGVCTVSSDSNGSQQDWLACPYRILDKHFTLLTAAVRLTFGISGDENLILAPVTTLSDRALQKRIGNALRKKTARVFVFTADKLGGEVDIPETVASPGAKVDVSVLEVIGLSAKTREPNRFGNHLFFEIQTADFHGSPLHAVRLLRERLPLAPMAGYHDRLRDAVEVCGTGVEGPNKANIFKRTIYQMVFKIQLAGHKNCAGFVIILPLPVWESWLRHLGSPKLVPAAKDATLSYLRAPREEQQELMEAIRAWILVFDIDRDSRDSPQPLRIVRKVATSSAALVHFAFDAAAGRALELLVIERYRTVLESRLREGWLGLAK